MFTNTNSLFETDEPNDNISINNITDIPNRSHTDLQDKGTNTHAQIDSHIASTSNPHSVTASQAGAIALTNLDTDVTLANPSNNKVASTLAIKTYVDTQAEGKIWLDIAVLDILTTPPTEPPEGCAYIVASPATGAWIGKETQIAQCNGEGGWNFYVPETLATVIVADEAISYTFNGTSWAPSSAQIAYTAGNGIDITGQTISVDTSTINPALEIADFGIRVKVDDTTIERTANGLELKDDSVTNSKIGETISITNGGTGKSTVGASNSVLGVNSAGNDFEYREIVAGSNMEVDYSSGQINLSAVIEGTPSFIYNQIDFHTDLGTSFTWTNLPAVITPSTIYKRANLDGVFQARVCCYQNIAGFAGSKLYIEFSSNGTTWQRLDDSQVGDLDIGTGTGLKTGAWINIDGESKGDVQLRLVGKGGDGVVDPQFRQIWLETKGNSSIVDMESINFSYDEAAIYCNAATALTWTNMPAAVTEFLASVYSRQKVDLTNFNQFRIFINQSVAGYAGAKLYVQYSLDNINWIDLASVSGADETDIGTGIGLKVGAWATIKAAAKSDVFIRLVGKLGDGIADPAFRQVKIQFKGAISSDTVINTLTWGNAGKLDVDTYPLGEEGDDILVPTIDCINGSGAIAIKASTILDVVDTDNPPAFGFIALERESISIFIPTYSETRKATLFTDNLLLGEGKSLGANTIYGEDRIQSPEGIFDTVNGIVSSGAELYSFIGRLADITGDITASARAMDTDGNYLYIGTYSETNSYLLAIFDLTDKDNPTLISPETITGMPNAGCKCVKYKDNKLYMTFATSGANAFRILDVTDRTNPTVIGGSNLTTLPNLGGGGSVDIHPTQDIVYLTGTLLAGNTDFWTIDVSTPSAPVILGSVISGINDIWNMKYIDGYCYVGGGRNVGGTNTLRIINVSNPASPTVEANTVYITDGIWNLAVYGDYLFVAAGKSFILSENPKFYIIDISIRTNPIILSSLFIRQSPCSHVRYDANRDICYLTNWNIDSSGEEAGYFGEKQESIYTIDVTDKYNPAIISQQKSAPAPVCIQPVGEHLYIGYAPFGGPAPYVSVAIPKGFKGTKAEALFNPLIKDNDTIPNNTIYYSVNESKLCYKDFAGVVHTLY